VRSSAGGLVNALATLSLADLRAVVDEYTRYVQDTCQAAENAERAATLRKLRSELERRVLEAVAS
jgi:hypothetical protein